MIFFDLKLQRNFLHPISNMSWKNESIFRQKFVVIRNSFIMVCQKKTRQLLHERANMAGKLTIKY